MPEPFCQAAAETEAEEAFVRAVKDADAARLRAVLEGHPELGDRIDEPWFDFDSPAIVWAASELDREKIRALLDHGADIDAKSRWAAGSYTALLRCLDGATPETLELASFLIECGATIDLHSAAGLGRVELVREMLDRDPERANERGPDGAMPLHLAATVELARLLLDRGANPAARCLDHNSTAGMWLLGSHPEVSSYLARHGGPVDLFMAAALGDPGLAERCLAQDPEAISARVGVGDWTRFTGGGDKYIWVLGLYRSPHRLAHAGAHDDLFRLLMDRSPPQLRLLAACECAERSLAEEVLERHPGLVERLPPEQMRALADAAWLGEVQSVRLMLELGFDPHVPGDHDSTPLDRAAFHGYREIVELLLAEDPRPPLARRNEFGGTPLEASLYGKTNGWVRGTDYPGTIRALLEAGSTYAPGWRPFPDPVIDSLLEEFAHAAVADDPA